MIRKVCGKTPRNPSILFLWQSRANARCATAATMHVDKDACRSRGLIVTNAGAAFAADLADHAPCGLDSRRQAPEGGHGRRDAYIHSGRWPANTRRRLPSRQQGEQQAGEDRGAGPLQTLPCRVPFPLGGIFYD